MKYKGFHRKSFCLSIKNKYNWKSSKRIDISKYQRDYFFSKWILITFDVLETNTVSITSFKHNLTCLEANILNINCLKCIVYINLIIEMKWSIADFDKLEKIFALITKYWKMI